MRVVVYVFSPLRGEYVVYSVAQSLDDAVKQALDALRNGRKYVSIEIQGE